MSREFKHYELRRAYKPSKVVGLATTVVVIREDGESGYCYVSFSDSFVRAVGLKLPRGISIDDPAYILVQYLPRKNLWEISARYLRENGCAILWTTEVRPSWLAFISEKRNGTGSQARGRRTRSEDTGSTSGADEETHHTSRSGEATCETA